MLGPQGLKPRIFQSGGSACPPWTQCGQGVMEFALLAGVLLLLVFGGLQMALIFNAALSVSQYSYAAVRYAAVHGTGSSASSYGNILLPTLPSSCPATCSGPLSPSPTICDSGLSRPVVTSADSSGNIVSGSEVTVTITYNLSTCGKIFLPAKFFGFSLSLPTSLTNSNSEMAE